MLTPIAFRGTSGTAHLGSENADAHAIAARRFDPHWNRGGRHDHPAELPRDDDLASYADAAVAVWDRKSADNGHLIRAMVRLGKETHVYDESGGLVSESKAF